MIINGKEYNVDNLVENINIDSNIPLKRKNGLVLRNSQLEILKRDKLDYTFQSLSVIAIVPMLAIEPIKNWALSQFSFTAEFYNGRNGMLVQILLIFLTFVCYILTRKLMAQLL